MIEISEEVKAEFLNFARENNNIEVCGLVIGDEQKQKFYKCDNAHETPETDFTISAEQFADAEDQGDVIMVLHSHNGDGARAIFSEMDIQGCNHSALPWGLVATESGEWNFLDCGFYSLIGRQFNLGTDDCYGLVMAWHETQGVKLDDFRVKYPWWERGENLYIDNLEKAGFIDSPMIPGCMVVMQVQSSVPNHSGIITEDGDLLHHLYGRLSEVTPFKSGYFRERVIRCVRHKDLPLEIKAWNK